MRFELLRKAAHVFAALFFVWLGATSTQYAVVVAAGTLFSVFVAARLLKKAQVFHTVARISYGDLFFALGLLSSALLFLPGHLSAWYAAVLVLGVADTSAAVLGQAFPYGVYTVWGEKRTMVGSGACVLVSCILLFTFGVLPWLAVLGGFILAALEASALKGADNLVLPVVAGSIVAFL